MKNFYSASIFDVKISILLYTISSITIQMYSIWVIRNLLFWAKIFIECYTQFAIEMLIILQLSDVIVEELRTNVTNNKSI